MPWRKPALAVAATIAVLAVAAFVALKLLVDPGKVKAAIEAKVRAASGRELHIGALALQVFPWPSLHATQVVLGNPAWATSRNALEVEQIDADLALIPLVVGKVHVKSLSLAGVKAMLEQAQDGKASWAAGDSAASAVSAKTDEAASVGEVHLHDVIIARRVAGVEAEPWVVQEATAHVDPGLRNVQVEARVLRHEQPLTVKAHFDDLSQLGTEGAATTGRIDLAWTDTSLRIEGRIPLHRSLVGHDVRIAAESASLQDVYRFYGIARGKTAALVAKAGAKGDGKAASLDDLDVKIGDLHVTGALAIATGDKPVVTGHLRSDRIDWLRTIEQTGGVVKPKRHDGEIFHADPVAWHAFEFLGQAAARIDVDVAGLKLGNGMELSNVRTRATLGDGKVAFDPFTTATLGGTASGSLRFDAAKKAIHASIAGEDLSLERWFRERGSKIPFRGGPMKVKVDLALAGATFRELAASVTGPVSLRMGPGVWSSPRAGEVEELMVSALAGKESKDIRFECIGANLDFRHGRAAGRRQLGARSDVSVLLTDGSVDFRDETVDLRGRVQAKKGITLGVAVVAGRIRIDGHIAKPHVGLDPAEKPAVVARTAAAIATAGATLVGEALLTSAEKTDPCAAVFK